ncbi:hypothetical protein Rsub_05029 [Raphidocelis subcapitata]|uniref:Cytochrome b5 heme-binding domain-containing protein n=1 Tax=Raphidocelis subcapitata TaxID=307507 RepID=A0A2V0P480_9CHLO|nr:hypothetical protein Rsub_05029 [Raphidocelis subcapitata]|eukprot:GBF92660.1 hypothetical protein Rsub_05029 [Raphidocelis subcapitata]
MSLLMVFAGIAAVYLILKIIQVLRELMSPPPETFKFQVGQITERSLAYYNGRDWAKPLLIALQGTVFDVTDAMDTYGPGKEFAVYAGRECARAVARGSLDPADVGSGEVSDLGPDDLARLEAKLAELREKKCHEAGKVVPMRDVTPEELAASDGSDPSRPMLIAIRGVVYDVTKGKDFYGPGGVYPFAGREVARAFAMLSTELSDCHDGLEGLSQMELDNLREWEEKFNWKYSIVGTLTGKALGETAGQKVAQQQAAAAAVNRHGANKAAAAVFGR